MWHLGLITEAVVLLVCKKKEAINTNWCIKKESLTMDVCSTRPIRNTKHDIYAKE